jgi:DNA-binding Lrp family transcriptional regulator
MDELDRQLLDIVQTGFPLCSRPYAELGKQIGIDEKEAMSRIRRMREYGIIRRVGANFDAYKLGWVSTLCAAKVPAERMDTFVSVVNRQPGATHNYERENEFNIWFTLTSPTREEEAVTLESIARETGVKILNLPASRLYKVKVDFQMSNRKKRPPERGPEGGLTA